MINVKKFINLDGRREEIKLEPKDDEHFQGENDNLPYQYDNDVIQAVQPTELGEALKQLNSDKITESRMSDIDMRSNLHPIECDSVLALDSLVALRFLPPSCLAFSRQKKRLVVSNDGRGRDDMVKVMIGQREHDENKSQSVIDRVKGFIGGK